MTDLQGALIVLGVLAVVAVAIYNQWQERQFRRKSDALLPDAQDDALLPGDHPRESGVSGRVEAVDARDDPPMIEPAVQPGHRLDERREPILGAFATAVHERAEPGFDPGADGARPSLDAGPSAPAASGASAPAVHTGTRRVDPRAEPATGLEGPAGLWYPIVFRLPAIVDAAALAVIRSDVSGERRLSDWLDPDLLAIASADGDEVGEPATIDRILRIQVVDPRGPASTAELQVFVSNAHRAAASVGGQVTAPDPATSAAQAGALYEFCNSVDVAIGLNVAASSGGFAGTKLRGLIEAAGFRALPDHTYVLADDAGNTLCTLTDGNGGGLDPQALRSQAVRAISLLLDVPRAPGTVAQFERMATQARQFAQALSGSVIDDSGRVLDEASIGRIRVQLASMLKAMRARGIEPGDAIARRIFG
ncbi:MAG: cell division protein ZipA C-terminal FtsZ-binding domain-containing protein [bacterium]